ncbi:uncharacterized protein VP01_110g7 [Puccinia sorghi]|uniref:Retrotransposon gag domain-containing protein n=1 Tax=Puccinia sorghi TaxID=27349 RepID=A0A0L6VSM5_9BASI|nr:uncharacterized protein VP01_110g7 [Puccinia sorghi]
MSLSRPPTPSSGSDAFPNAMDALNTRIDEVMRMITKERAQRLATEEMLRQTQARLDAQKHSAPAPVPNPIKLAKPQLFDGTRGAAAKVFVAQIALHVITYPESFPTDASKVAFATSFMRDYAATWYLEASFFDHNRQHQAEVALRNIRQTGTVSNYTQDFNQHARTTGWPDAPLMSLYQNGLKENVQLAVVMSNIQFDSLRHPTSPPRSPPRP